MASASLNKVMLIGFLGKDPEVRYSQGGKAVVSFSLATNEEWSDKTTGEKRKKVEWHNIVVFGKLGEICGKYLKKGRHVYLEGQLETRPWEQDGITRYKTEVVVRDMRMLDSSKKGGVQNAYSPNEAEVASQAATYGYQGVPSGWAGDDDIPF